MSTRVTIALFALGLSGLAAAGCGGDPDIPSASASVSDPAPARSDASGTTASTLEGCGPTAAAPAGTRTAPEVTTPAAPAPAAPSPTTVVGGGQPRLNDRDGDERDEDEDEMDEDERDEDEDDENT